MDSGLASWLDAGLYFDYLGFDIFYRVEGSGPPLLLIHGYPFNSFDWQPIWSTLTSRFTVIAPDMMGMGFSAKPVHYEYSVHDHADMHEALLVHLGIEKAHILAHDLGDSVGQELLARKEFGRPCVRRTEYRLDHLAQRWDVRRDLHAAGRAEADVGNAAGRHPESRAKQPAVASPAGADVTGDVRPEHQTDPAHDGRIQPDPGLQRRPAGAAQGRPIHQRPPHAPESVGAGHAGNRCPDAADRRADRPQLRCAHGAPLRRGDSQPRRGDACRRHRALAATGSARCGAGRISSPTSIASLA